MSDSKIRDAMLGLVAYGREIDSLANESAQHARVPVVGSPLEKVAFFFVGMVALSRCLEAQFEADSPEMPGDSRVGSDSESWLR